MCPYQKQSTKIKVWELLAKDRDLVESVQHNISDVNRVSSSSDHVAGYILNKLQNFCKRGCENDSLMKTQQVFRKLLSRDSLRAGSLVLNNCLFEFCSDGCIWNYSPQI